MSVLVCRTPGRIPTPQVEIHGVRDEADTATAEQCHDSAGMVTAGSGQSHLMVIFMQSTVAAFGAKKWLYSVLP